MSDEPDEDHNKPFSAFRVVVWAVGMVTFVAMNYCGAFILLWPELPVPAPMGAIALAGLNALGVIAGYAVGKSRS